MSNNSEPLRVWVVDSDKSTLAESVPVLAQLGDCKCFSFPQTEAEGLTIPDILLVSAEIEGGAEGEFFSALIKKFRDIPVIIAARVRSFAQALSFFRSGAADYLTLPLELMETAERLEAALLKRAKAGESDPVEVAVEVEETIGEMPRNLSLVVESFRQLPCAEDDDILAALPTEDDPTQNPPSMIDTGSAPSQHEGEPASVIQIDEEKSRQATQAEILEQLPCGYMALDLDGNLTVANAIAMETLGYDSLAELQDKWDSRRGEFGACGLNGKEIGSAHWPDMQALKSKARRSGCISVERPDNRRIWLRIDCLPVLSEGRVRYVAVTLTNVTDDHPPLKKRESKRK